MCTRALVGLHQLTTQCLHINIFNLRQPPPSAAAAQPGAARRTNLCDLHALRARRSERLLKESIHRGVAVVTASPATQQPGLRSSPVSFPLGLLWPAAVLGAVRPCNMLPPVAQLSVPHSHSPDSPGLTLTHPQDPPRPHGLTASLASLADCCQPLPARESCHVICRPRLRPAGSVAVPTTCRRENSAMYESRSELVSTACWYMLLHTSTYAGLARPGPQAQAGSTESIARTYMKLAVDALTPRIVSVASVVLWLRRRDAPRASRSVARYCTIRRSAVRHMYAWYMRRPLRHGRMTYMKETRCSSNVEVDRLVHASQHGRVALRRGHCPTPLAGLARLAATDPMHWLRYALCHIDCAG